MPSSVAAQIASQANPSQTFIALTEAKDETAVLLEAETRLLATTIFTKLMQKKKMMMA